MNETDRVIQEVHEGMLKLITETRADNETLLTAASMIVIMFAGHMSLNEFEIGDTLITIEHKPRTNH